MRKSRYVTMLMAGVATGLLGACDQHDMTKDDKVYSDATACAQDVDAAACTEAYEQAKEEHLKQAPKFTTRAECEAAGYPQCDVAQVRTADGGYSSMFMPIMMGYMMGRMFSGGGYGGGSYAPTQAAPVREDDKKDRSTSGTSGGAAAGRAFGRPVYGDRNGYLYTGGNAVGRVAPGTTSLGAGTSIRAVSRGGFGSRGFGGGS